MIQNIPSMLDNCLMRSRSYLSSQILIIGLFIFSLVVLLLSPVYSKYGGSGQGSNDSVRGIAINSAGNAYVTKRGARPIVLNSVLNSTGRGHLATATTPS